MKQMKNSGIEWIGMIPEDWDIVPVKHFFSIGRGRVISVLDLSDDGEYPVYSSQTENNGCFGYLKTYDYSGPSITWTTDGAKAGTVFFRDRTLNRDYEHTGFTSMENVKEYSEKQGYTRDTNKDLLLNYSVDEIDLSTITGAESAVEVEIEYSDYQTTSYKYDSTNENYLHFLLGFI